MADIDKDNSTLRMYDWTYKDIPLLELRRWIDAQIEKGNNNVNLEIGWGYYDDIDEIDLVAGK